MPGTAKAPEELRDAGLFERFATVGASDSGVVLPGRYLDDADPTHQRVRNHDRLVDHARRLALRLDAMLDRGVTPLLLGGDCSILVGTGVALSRRGRFGLLHLDGHTDFRHPGNSADCASVAGEDLAAAVGLHWPAIADIDGLGPYFRAEDSVQVGCRDDDEHLAEASGLLGTVIPAQAVLREELLDQVQAIREIVDRSQLDGYWLHVDVDVLDPAVMPAVDSPDPGGLDPPTFVALLAALAPRATGAQVTVFDPDLDPDGRRAALLTDLVFDGLGDLGRDRSC